MTSIPGYWWDLGPDLDPCIAIVRALRKFGDKDINQSLLWLLTYLGANVRRSRRSMYMDLYKEI